MRLKITKTGKEFKKVFNGLDWISDNQRYQLTLESTFTECLKVLWLLKFPKKNITRTWSKIES